MAKLTENDLEECVKNFTSLISARLAEINGIAAERFARNGIYQNILEDLGELTGKLSSRRHLVGGRPPDVHFESRWMFWPVAAVVASFDTVINKPLMDMAIQSIGFISYAAAFVISVIIVALAHVSGMTWRQIRCQSEQKWVLSRVFASIALSSFILAAVLGLMWTRTYYTISPENAGGLGDIFGGLTTQLTKFDFWGIILQAFGSTEAIVLGLLNFGGALVAFGLGFFGHDSDYHYDNEYSRHKQKKIEKEKADQAYQDHHDEIRQRYAKFLKMARSAYDAARKRTNLELASNLALPEDNYAKDRKSSEGALVDPHDDDPGSAPHPRTKSTDSVSLWTGWGKQ